MQKNQVLALLDKYKNEALSEVVKKVSPKMPFSDQIVKAMIIDLMNCTPSLKFKDEDGNDIKSKKFLFSKAKKSKKPGPPPKPFIPDLADLINERQDWNQAAKENSNRNFRVRIARVSFSVSSPIIFLIIATYQEFPLNQVIGLALFVMFTVYFSMVLFYAFSVGSLITCDKEKQKEISDDKLYRVYSISRRPQNWADINTGYIQLQYKHSSVQSISELSAITGGITKVMLNTLGAYTWAAVAIHYAGELYYNRCVFKWDGADVAEICGTIGLLFISIFELDPFNGLMVLFHYIGAALGTGTIIGYNIQQFSLGEKAPLAIIIGIIAAICFVLWQLTGVATDMSEQQRFAKESEKKLKEDGADEDEIANTMQDIMRKRSKLACLIPTWATKYHVNTYSKANIGFEALFLYLGALSLCLYLIEYNKNCSHGCAGLNKFEEIQPDKYTECVSPIPLVWCVGSYCYISKE